MKKYKLLLLIILPAFIFSCQEYDPETPEACLTISAISGYSDNGQPIYEEAATFKTGDKVIISSCSTADKFSVYTGADGSVYGQNDAVGTSLSSDPDAIVSTSYSAPGTYTITLIATNYSMGSTDVELVRSVVSKDIVVTE